jgi:hypothetical protein
VDNDPAGPFVWYTDHFSNALGRVNVKTGDAREFQYSLNPDMGRAGQTVVPIVGVLVPVVARALPAAMTVPVVVRVVAGAIVVVATIVIVAVIVVTTVCVVTAIFAVVAAILPTTMTRRSVVVPIPLVVVALIIAGTRVAAAVVIAAAVVAAILIATILATTIVAAFGVVVAHDCGRNLVAHRVAVDGREGRAADQQ